MRYNYKKGISCIILLFVMLGFTACGDDVTVTISGLEDSIISVDSKNVLSVGAGSAEETSGIQLDATQNTTETQVGTEVGAETDSEGNLDTSLEIEENGRIEITISAAGDVSLGNHQDQNYPYSFNQEYDNAENESYFFQNVYDIFSADDMTLVNLEGVLTLSEERDTTRTYNIKGAPEYAKILTAGSVEAVSMGNNHRLDYGEAGTVDTVAALEAENIVYAYDSNIGIYETKGIRIGYFSINVLAWGSRSAELAEEVISTLKEEKVDLIIATIHWGIEGEYYPENTQMNLGRTCIDLGADMVIGTHPHVIQGIECYEGKYIVYSLGNFCFGANRNPADKDTFIYQQTFTFEDGIKQEESEVNIIPCSLSSVSSRNDFQPTPVLADDAARIIDRLNTFNEQFGTYINEDGSIIK